MKNFTLSAVLFLAAVSLYLENFSRAADAELLRIVTDLIIVVLSVSETVFSLVRAKYRRVYLSANMAQLAMLVVFILLSSADRIMQSRGLGYVFSNLAAIIVFRNIFMLVRSLGRFLKASLFFSNMAVNPALTIVISFLAVILAGAVFLAMPFASADGKPLSFLDSFFTSTSAVCVTGLIVTDTATRFSFMGKIIIMILIQTGGLGIMILSFSTVFMFRKSVSLENRLLISYMINEDDMRKISASVKRIVFLTFIIEAAGAALLFVSWRGQYQAGERVFNSIFHSVSAFCNAGFALFSDSLEQFHSNPGVVLTIASLIIAGGISFAVMSDIGSNLYRKVKCAITGKYGKIALNTNSWVVLYFTMFLLISGTLLVYFFEHGNSMKDQPLAVQYLSAFFQSVTLRTAGFNTISFASLAPATLFLMILYMFAGGASGSTAGGIKVNTLAVISAYLRSSWKKERNIVIHNREIAQDTVLKAFSVLSLGLVSVMAGFLLLLSTENAEPLDLLFETVSAFATVGLSAGVTPDLSAAGKIVIIMLMFAGRLGPLTLVSSIGAEKAGKLRHRYPAADISIG